MGGCGANFFICRNNFYCIDGFITQFHNGTAIGESQGETGLSPMAETHTNAAKTALAAAPEEAGF